MKARGLEFAAHVGEDRRGASRHREAASAQQAIDIEHPEANAFDVKRADGARQRLTLDDDGLQLSFAESERNIAIRASTCALALKRWSVVISNSSLFALAT